MIRAPKVAVGGKLPRPRWGLDLLLHPFLPSREEKDVENRDTLAHSFPYINRYSNRATFQVTWVRRRPRHATFWRRCVPAAPSCRILRSLRASGPVMRHSGVAACQRPRHATFWRACVPAAPSCDILGSLRASGPVMPHFGVAACQRSRQATFSRRCVPAEPSSDFLASLRASGAVKRVFGAAVCQRSRQATFSRRCVPASPSSDFFTPLRASGAVKRLFRAAACQRARQATFWRHLRPSGTVKRLGGERKAEDVGLHAHDPCHNDSAGSFCNGSTRGRGQGFGPKWSVKLP